MEYRTELTLFVYNRDRSNHLRGELQIVLPFVPSVGMHIQYTDMYPLQVKKVVWLTDQESFKCVVEPDARYEFSLNTDVEELIDLLDVLRDARGYGWAGLDKIYRDK